MKIKVKAKNRKDKFQAFLLEKEFNVWLNKNKIIDEYMQGMYTETSSRQYKPFFTLYAKKRHWLNPLKYIFGEYKYRWFEKDKQPVKYKNAFELLIDSIDLDVKNIEIK